MVRAIIEGRKTVTRRIAKPVKHPDLGNIYAPGALVLENEPNHVIERACPYGQPGDRLWVRETFAVYGDKKMHVIHYRADRPHHVGQKGMGYKPSIHMPRWACRIVLEISAVRVERLHDISEEEALAEGVRAEPCDHVRQACSDIGCWGSTAKGAFGHLWESINGAGAWTANPWVWVVEFKRVTS
jgi:hypothetical protein